jgi:sugar lactone lactonase YvrE
MAQIECVVPGRNRLGESPVWSVREQVLYWVDSRGPAVYRYDPASGDVRSHALPAVAGSVQLRRSGGVIVALQTGFHGFDFATGTLTPLVDPEADQPENRFNDGRVDRRGRIWCGTMNDTRRDPTGSLYRLDPDRTWTAMRDDIIVPNSISWSPDDRVMYFADTYRHYIMSYAFDLDAGTIRDGKVIVDTTDHPGRPDGSTVDADGFLWNAEFAAGRLVRYAPDGRIDRTIELPVTNATSCSFGGPNLDVLYVTTATQWLGPEQLAAQPLAGSVFAVDAGVRGLPEPEYLG